MFGPFELDVRTGELRRGSAAVPLQPKPARLLALLASRPGQLVTRGQIREAIWADRRFLEFDQSLNFAVRRIRRALGDHASHPAYVETLPRRGYRFVAGVRRRSPGAASARRRRLALALGAAAGTLLALATLALSGSRSVPAEADATFGARGPEPPGASLVAPVDTTHRRQDPQPEWP